jgi:hypothetical protein
VFFGTEEGVQHFAPWGSVTEIRDARDAGTEPEKSEKKRDPAGYLVPA